MYEGIIEIYIMNLNNKINEENIIISMINITPNARISYLYKGTMGRIKNFRNKIVNFERLIRFN